MGEKVLFLIGKYGTGGKERQLYEIISGLPDDKYEVYIFMKSYETYYFNRLKGKIKGTYILNKRKFILTDIFKLNNYISEIGPNVIFSLSKTTSHFAFIINIIMKYKFKLINASIRDAPIKLNNYLKLEAYLYNMYSCVISNSIAGLKSYKQNKRTGRHVVYNGFNFNRIPKISKFNLRDNLELNNKFIITMVGSMGVRKDQNIFIKASNIVLEKSPEVLFILIGDGPKRTEYEKFVNQLNLNNNVIFLGILENVESYLKASDISVLTSSKLHGEGIPNVVMESFACGTPVIATDNGGTCEIVKNDVNGYLINVNNHNELAAKILYLKNNPDILKRFSFNGKNIIKEKFSSEVMIKNLRNVLDC